MSRCILKVKPDANVDGVKIVSIVIGLDPPMNTFFYDIYGEDDEHGDECILTPLLDTLGCSKSKLVEVCHEYADRTDAYTKACISDVSLDLDPGFVLRRMYYDE